MERGRPRPGPWLDDMAGEAPIRHAESGVWHVFGYADVERVLTDHQRFSSVGAVERRLPEGDALKTSIVVMDPPWHHLYRAVVSEAFTPRMVAQMEPRIRAIAQQLLDAARPCGSMDFVQDFAFPLPAAVIAELLGVPLERRDDFKRWSDDVVSIGLTGDATAQGVASLKEMGLLFYQLIEERRREPRQDLISALLGAEVGGKRLDPVECTGFCILLLIAGSETTTSLLSNAVSCLVQHPEAASRLRQDPSLTTSAIEEVLRFRSPVFGLSRRARVDVELRGRRIAANERVFAWIASANRDPEVFPQPHRFDIERRPNHHVAFGHGIHFCLGAPLARAEAAVALPMLLQQLPDLRLSADEAPEPLDSSVVTGFKRLPVAYTPGP
jgi:cytochrome P450